MEKEYMELWRFKVKWAEQLAWNKPCLPGAFTPWSHPHQKRFSVSGTVADLSTTNPEIKVSNPATGQLNEGKSAASFCRMGLML
jgi:hypothetical protein